MPRLAAWLVAALGAASLAVCGSAAQDVPSLGSGAPSSGSARLAAAATGPHSVAFLPNFARALGHAASVAHGDPAPEVIITPSAWFHGVVNFGAPELLAGVHAKLLRGAGGVPECLRVVALGGSITCAIAGGLQNRSDHPQSVDDAWPSRFGAALNAAFPCAAKHTVLNLCQGAVASDFWVDRVVDWRPNGEQAAASPLAGADLVIVDTAHNDVEELNYREHHLDKETRIGKYNELLINLLLRPASGAPPPAVMYVALSTRGGFASRAAAAPGGGRADGVWAQAPVTRHYGVPQVSVVDALGPFAPGSAQEAWFGSEYKSDGWGHPNVLGHQLGAALLFQLLAAHMASLQLRVLPAFGPANANATQYTLPATLLYASDEELRMYLDGSPVHINAPEPSPARGLVRVAARVGFEAKQDMPGKPTGLIASDVGAFATWLVPASTLVPRAGRLRGALHVLSLKTYDRMGTLRVELLRMAGPACESVNLSLPFSREALGMQTIANATIDCLRPPEQHVSEVAVDALSFNASAVISGGACLLINATTVESAPPRAENKIKLMSFVLF